MGLGLLALKKKVGITSAFVAELWGVHQGLQVARQKGIQSLILQIDSMLYGRSLVYKKEFDGICL